MDNSDWAKLKHFKKSENWGSPEKMNTALVFMLDIFREVVKTPIYVSCGIQGKHVAYSTHYTGNAVDILFPNKLIEDLPELASEAEKVGFTGIGIYNCWELHGVSTPGMHLDNRPGKVKKWIGIETLYLPFNEVNVKRYFTCSNLTTSQHNG